MAGGWLALLSVLFAKTWVHPALSLTPGLGVIGVLAATRWGGWRRDLILGGVIATVVLVITVRTIPVVVRSCMTSAAALLAAMRWLRTRRTVGAVVWPAAVASLAVGAWWLLCDRAGVEPAGFTAPFVQLTAIHFHYAGFTSSLLAGCAWRLLPPTGPPRWPSSRS